jgi:uncharacterized membrane protein YbhN (UPF0104 family)
MTDTSVRSEYTERDSSGLVSERLRRSPLREILRWVLAISLAAGLLWWSVRGTDRRHVGTILAHARWMFIALACAIGSVSFFLRAFRWRVLLSARERLGAVTVFWATMAGYLCNNLLPGRAGEFIRSVMISRRSSLSKTYVLTTTMTERLTDAIVLVIVCRLLLITMQQKPPWMARASTLAFALGVLGASLVVGLRFFHGFIRRVLAALPLPARFNVRLAGWFDQVVLGFSALDHFGRAARFCGLTLSIWIVDAVSSMITAHALGLTISFPLAILLITSLGLGGALPSTPGAVGIFQAVAITVLVPFGFTREEALTYILVAQAASYLVVAAWGALGLWRMGQ